MCSKGSLSSRFAPKIVITKTGEKFPPHGYDPNAAPGAIVTNTTRRNGQVHITRRAGKPIVVRRAATLWPMDEDGDGDAYG